MSFLCKISKRLNLRKLNCFLDNTFVTMLHSITVDMLVSLSSHIYFNSSVLFLYLRCLKSQVLLLKRLHLSQKPLTQKEIRKKTRKRKTIVFNQLPKINVGRIFSKLIKKQFSKVIV